VTTNLAPEPEGLPQEVTPGSVIDRFNQGNRANRRLYVAARHTADRAARALHEAEQAQVDEENACDAWDTAQLEHPERRAWLPLMSLIALVLLTLDSWAAYFAAEALGGDQRATLLWAALFLVILGLLEAGLAWSAERNRKIFRVIAVGLGTFAVLLALLRLGFFAAVGAGPVGSLIGAAVFTVCTIMFVLGGFAAVRYAETLAIWQARRHARKAKRKSADAKETAARLAAERDRRVDVYIGQIRPTLLHEFADIHDIENKVMAHMLGEQT
jgi:lipoprotein signal peptidase